MPVITSRLPAPPAAVKPWGAVADGQPPTMWRSASAPHTRGVCEGKGGGDLSCTMVGLSGCDLIGACGAGYGGASQEHEGGNDIAVLAARLFPEAGMAVKPGVVRAHAC